MARSHPFLRVAAALLAGAAATPAAAQTAPAGGASASSSASVEILKPLTFQKRQDLDFGIVLPGTATGTVYVRNDDSVVTSGGSGPRAAGGTPQHAEYVTTGGPRMAILIVSDLATIRLRRVGGGAPDIVMNLGGPSTLPQPINARFVLNNAGVYTFTLGATITVAAGQPEGDYGGSFNLTATYF